MKCTVGVFDQKQEIEHWYSRARKVRGFCTYSGGHIIRNPDLRLSLSVKIYLIINLNKKKLGISTST